MKKDNSQPYYAAMLSLQGRLCVVAGGGFVAKRKIAALLHAGAAVRVVSPQLVAQLHDAVKMGVLDYVPRSWKEGDGDNAWLIVAATNDREVNRAIALQAEARRQWVNVVDDPSLCTLIVPASISLPDVLIAISTRGANPSRAKQLRKALESDVAQGTDQFIGMLRQKGANLPKER